MKKNGRSTILVSGHAACRTVRTCQRQQISPRPPVPGELRTEPVSGDTVDEHSVDEHAVDDNRWRSTEHAEAWLDRQTHPSSDLIERFELIARLLPFDHDATLTFADVGAGNGTLGEVLLDTFPRARVVSLDVNPAMIAAGEQRLARFGDRSRFIEFDFGGSAWPAVASGPFDAVVSSRAIHHVSDEQKRVIFGWIYDRLRPGGWLVNYDYIRAPTEALSAVYARLGTNEPRGDGAGHGRGHGHDHGNGHGHGDRPGHTEASGSSDHHQGHHSHISPLLGQLAMLEALGFLDVDVFWKQFGSVVFGARHP
jgi:SAM-dependent methyltransferase